MDTFTTAVEGIETEFAEQGAQQATLLVHGWGATKRIWRHLWAPLVARGRVLAPDLPGWGGSDKPDAPYTPEWYARWLRAFLDARGVEQTDVVAHSMGAMAAVILAAEHAGRVRRLVLVNPPVEGPTAFSRRTQALARPGIRWLLHKLLGMRAVRGWVARDFTYAQPLDQADLDAILQGSYGSMVRSIRGMTSTSVRPQLATLRMPVLVVGTTHDRVVESHQAELAAGTVAGARRVTIDECGHCPMVEKPGEFNRVVLDFLAEGREGRRPPQW